MTATPLAAAEPKPSIAVELSEAERFLACLDPDAKFFTFQTFDDNSERKDPKLVKVLHGTLAEHAAKLQRLNDKGAGIFVTANETDGKGRKADNVVRIRTLFVDLDGSPLDPVLASQPPPHVVSETSPGRWHCYWRITNLPLEQFRDMQKALAARFGGDPSVHDLPRVMRLPGFAHRKGEPFASHIVSVREGVCAAADFPATSEFLRQHAGAGVVKEPPSESRLLNNEALQKLSAWVPVLFGSAAVLNKSSGGYRVSSKALGRKLQEDLSISPQGIKDFGVHDLGDPHSGGRTAIDLVMEHRKVEFQAAADWLHERLGHNRNKPQRAAPTPKLESLLKSAAVLRTKTFVPLRWIVPQYLPEGLTILGGKPKIGKSWQALDMATAVASGGTCLGQQCEQGDVLAMFLEDTDRRLQRRMTQMLGAQLKEWPARLTYATDWPLLEDGGLDLISEWITKAENPRLVIIDILERVRKRSRSKQNSQYSEDYEALAALQKLAGEAQLGVLPLHHQRKMGADDLIDTLSGTLGLGGAVDAFIILARDDTGFYLYGRGRDLEMFSVAVEQDTRGRWQVLGEKSEAQPSAERNKIVALLTKATGPMTVEAVAAALGMKKQNVKMLLSKVHANGDIERVATGLYWRCQPQADLDLGLAGSVI